MIAKIFKLENPLISLSHPFYSSLIMIVLPFMNFLSGISVNLYSPSLPSIANALHVTIAFSQNTIASSIFGFASGCAFFGPLLDLAGRRIVMMLALSLFIVASCLAPYCLTIYQLFLALFLQGAATSAVSIGCRAMIADSFQGKRCVIAVLYASLAYGMGVMVGPSIGGYLEYYFGWHANFYALSLFAALILLIFSIFVKEQYHKPNQISLLKILTYYKTLIQHRQFLLGSTVLGLIQLLLTIYPTLAPNYIEHHLHYSSIIYGKNASLVSAGYLIGTLISRLILPYSSSGKLIKIGMVLSILLAIFQLCLAIFFKHTLLTLSLPICFMGFASGLIFGSLLSQLLTSFLHVATSLSVQFFILMGVSSLGIFVINFFSINSLYQISAIYLTIIILQWVFYVYYQTKNEVY